MSQMRVDLIIPFLHFEEVNLEKLKEFHLELTSKSQFLISWILVQDCRVTSEEKMTNEQLLTQLDLPVRYFNHQSNQGKGAAIQTGAAQSNADYFLFTDADLTYPVSTILEFFEKIISFDIVIGQRNHQKEKLKRSFKRKILSSFISILNHYLWALPVRDTQCGLKMFKQSMKPLVLSIKCQRYLFDWELLMRGEQKQISIGVVPVSTDNHEDSTISNKTLNKELIGLTKSFFWPIFTFSLISILMSFLILTSIYKMPNGEFAIRNYIASDFNSHIHQINHMNFVDSWPDEYPLHCGEENRYHFFYYKLVSLGTKLGLSFDKVLNLMSLFSWIGVIFLLLYWSWLLTGSWFVVVAAPLLFYLNSSLNIINIIDFNHLPRLSALASELWNRREFLAFGPWGAGDIAAFWSLHVFLNQRHFILGLFLLALAVIFFAQRNRKTSHKYFLISFIVPILYLMHRPCLMALCVVMAVQFFFPPYVQDKTRKKDFWLGLYALLLIIGFNLFSPSPIIQEPFLKFGYLWGYLPNRPWYDFFLYWIKNLGVFLPFFFLGIFFLKKYSFKLILPVLVLIALSLNIQFAREMAGNHKFFNIFIYFTIPVALLGVQILYQKIFKFPIIKQSFIACSLILLCLGGLLDQLFLWRAPYMFFPNAEQKTVIDYLKAQPDKGCILTNGLYYNPSIWAGNPVYLAWPYFSWGLGYPTEERTRRLNFILRAPTKKMICQFANMENLHWLLIEKINDKNGVLPAADPINYSMLFKPALLSPNNLYGVFNLKDQCREIIQPLIRK